MERKDSAASKRDSEMMHSYKSSSAAEKSTEVATGKKKKPRVGAFEVADVSEKKDTDAKPKIERLADVIQLDDYRPKTEETETTATQEPEEKVETTPSESLESDVELPENLEELSEGEEREALLQILEVEGEHLEDEHTQTPEDSPAEAEVLVAAAFLQAANEKIQAGMDRAKALTEAREEVIGDLELAPAADEVVPEDMEGAVEALDTEMIADLEPLVDDEPDDETEPDPLHTITTPTTTPTPQTTPAPPGGPVPPGPMPTVHGSAVPPSFPAYHQVAAAGGGIPPGGGMNPNLTPMPTPFELAAQRNTAERHRTRNRAVDLLVGGIVGYMIGRRRGRINAEERMRPVQQSLEKKVKQLQYEVSEGTKSVRKLTAERIATQGEPARQRIVDGVENRVQKRVRPGVPDIIFPAAAAAVAAERSEQPPEQSVRPERPTTEAAPAIEQQQRRERILQGPDILPVLVPGIAAEAAPRRSETAMPEKIPMSEVLQVASKIEIAGTNAKVLYEQGRLEKQDLQVIAQEYVRGSNRYERILIEKLRPPRTGESMEYLPGQASTQADSGMAGGGAAPVFSPPTTTDPTATQAGAQPSDMAAENRLAQARLEAESQKRSASTTLIVIAAVAGVIIAGVGIAIL
jgi:hypothetical protein